MPELRSLLTAEAYLLEQVPLHYLVVCGGLAALGAVMGRLGRRPSLLTLALLGAPLLYGRALPGFLLTAGAVLAFCALVGRLTDHAPRTPWRWRACCVAIGTLILVFLVGREQSWADRLTVGQGDWRCTLFQLDMFLALRLVTFLWEFGARRISPTGRGYVCWAALPFAAFGPVLRYSELEPALRAGASAAPRPAVRLCVFGDAALRLLLGLACAAAFHHVFRARDVDVPYWLRALLGFNLAPWTFYLLVSGSTRFMEASAPAWGLTLPPSFDRPFGRSSLSEFWGAWNMTATRVFRDYLFFNRWGAGRPNLVLNSFLVFVAVGLWHGANLYWVLWGALHGLGFGATLAWRTRRLPVPGGPVGTAVCALATYLFVCGCWVLPSRLLSLAGVVPG